MFLAAVFYLALTFFIGNNAFSEEENMDNPFGVLEFLHWQHAWNCEKYTSPADLTRGINLIKQSGAGWVRVDFLWDDIEPSKGKFNFRKYDRIVNSLRRQKINILGILDYSAAWASSDGRWNSKPEDYSVFINYAQTVIKRYKDRVKFWELWNEPDSSTYWEPQDGLKSYCALLKEFYPAAKQIDPDCKVLNGGFAMGASSINRLYDNGAKDYFDILNIHIFMNPLRKESIKGVAAAARLAYKIMSRNGDWEKKIWVTEIGCPGVKPEMSTGNWWLGRNTTELQQAEWVKKVYTELLSNEHPYVQKVFWAYLRDCKGQWSNGIDYFGLVSWDFSPKPAYRAYKKCFNTWKKHQVSDQ